MRVLTVAPVRLVRGHHQSRILGELPGILLMIAWRVRNGIELLVVLQNLRPDRIATRYVNCILTHARSGGQRACTL
jgi:hypothetical protein